jgi:hypothetical protein
MQYRDIPQQPRLQACGCGIKQEPFFHALSSDSDLSLSQDMARTIPL